MTMHVEENVTFLQPGIQAPPPKKKKKLKPMPITDSEAETSGAGGSGAASEVEIVFKLHPKMNEQKELVAPIKDMSTRLVHLFTYENNIDFISELQYPSISPQVHQDDDDRPRRAPLEVPGHENLPGALSLVVVGRVRGRLRGLRLRQGPQDLHRPHARTEGGALGVDVADRGQREVLEGQQAHGDVLLLPEVVTVRICLAVLNPIRDTIPYPKNILQEPGKNYCNMQYVICFKHLEGKLAEQMLLCVNYICSFGSRMK